MQYSDNQKKFTVVVNKKSEPATIMNALAHVCLGLGEAGTGTEFLDYERPDLTRDARISKYPVIVFAAKNATQLLRLVKEANEANVDHNYFTEQMIAGSAQEQFEANRTTKLEELNLICVAMFGDRDVVDPLNKRFSLFRAL